MKLTNKYNLPDIIVRAIGELYPPRRGRVSVTNLIDAPLIRLLKMKYWDQLEEDVSDHLWGLLGQAAHEIIQRGRTHIDRVEQKLEISVYGTTVTGRADLLQGEEELIDLKVTSVYSFLLGEKEAWKKQLNVYNYMFSREPRPVQIKRAKIYGILRDWQKAKGFRDRDYPEIPFFIQEVDLWPLEKTQKYVEENVLLHQWAEEYFDTPPEGLIDPMLLCTDADRWLRPTTYAVHKKRAKRALRVFNTVEEAGAYAIKASKGKGGLVIDERPGEAIRCERFCSVRKVCPLYRKESPNVVQTDGQAA